MSVYMPKINYILLIYRNLFLFPLHSLYQTKDLKRKENTIHKGAMTYTYLPKKETIRE